MTRRALIWILATAVAGCTSGGPQASVAATDLTIFAAASLAAVMEDVKGAYEASVPRTSLTLATDSSAALEIQIEQGAPADLFLAADTSNPKKLVDGGFAVGEAVVFAGNELTVIVPKGNPAGIVSPADLGRDGVKVIAAGDEVPITKYATRLIANLAKEPGYSPDFAAGYRANVVSKEDNVKAIVTKVGLGEGDAGVVYVTDAKASTDVETVEVPEAAAVRADYAGVVVKASRHPDAARAFLSWLAGSEGEAILTRFGVLPAPS